MSFSHVFPILFPDLLGAPTSQALRNPQRGAARGLRGGRRAGHGAGHRLWRRHGDESGGAFGKPSENGGLMGFEWNFTGILLGFKGVEWDFTVI